MFNLNPLDTLSNYAYWLTEFDKRLMQEDISLIERRHIIDFCFERGINANKISGEEAIELVKSRLEFSNMLAKTTDHSNY